MQKTLVIGSTTLGLIFLVLAVYYWMTPAGSLPGFMPGYIDSSTHVHFKHGLGALILGIACFIFAWFKSGPKVAPSAQ
jgi:hypothetical protein